MKRFIEGADRSQVTLFPDRLEDYVADDNPVRVVDGFVDQLDLSGLGFKRVDASVTGRPGYYRSDLLKLHIYGYLNRIQSSRRLEREASRNVEVMWLIGMNTATESELRSVRSRFASDGVFVISMLYLSKGELVDGKLDGSRRTIDGT